LAFIEEDALSIYNLAIHPSDGSKRQTED